MLVLTFGERGTSKDEYVPAAQGFPVNELVHPNRMTTEQPRSLDQIVRRDTKHNTARV